MIIPYGGDWHLRHSVPICRTDNYSSTIIKKLQWLKQYEEKYGFILSGGDLFDKDLYKSASDVVLTLKIIEKHLPTMIGIIGNHDLLYRSVEYLERSTISVPMASGLYKHIEGYYDLDEHTRVFGFDYGMGGISHTNKENLIDGCNIAMMHEYTSKKKNDLFGKYVGKELLQEFPEYDIILTADNHTTFTEEYEGRILINPGSFMRMDADQIEHKPSIFLIDTEKKSFEQVFVPIAKDAISTEHIQIEKDRDDRITSFVISMDEEYEITDQFEKNLEKYIAENRVDKETNTVLINKNVEKFINMSLEDV